MPCPIRIHIPPASHSLYRSTAITRPGPSHSTHHELLVSPPQSCDFMDLLAKLRAERMPDDRVAFTLILVHGMHGVCSDRTRGMRREGIGPFVQTGLHEVIDISSVDESMFWARVIALGLLPTDPSHVNLLPSMGRLLSSSTSIGICDNHCKSRASE